MMQGGARIVAEIRGPRNEILQELRRSRRSARDRFRATASGGASRWSVRRKRDLRPDIFDAVRRPGAGRCGNSARRRKAWRIYSSASRAATRRASRHEAFFTLWRKELASYFLSPIAYVMMMFFLLVMGVSFSLLVSVMASGPAGVTMMKELFSSIFFWIAMLIVVPVLTMRFFAEEKRSGTIETLMTAPVTDTAVVLAKYAGAMTFFVILWLPTASYAFILKAFSPLTAPVDLGPMLGGYVGAFLVGAMYIAIGLFCSSMTNNQIVAAITCFAMICVAFFAGFIPYITRSELFRDFGGYVSSISHMLDFSRGAVDTRPIVFYLTVSALMLFATIKVIESRKWK